MISPKLEPFQSAGVVLGFVWSMLVLMLIICGISGCTKDRIPSEYLIRVGDREITLLDFNQAVKTAGEDTFPGERNLNSEAVNHLRVQVLNQLSEELIILEHGEQVGITVSEADLDQAVADIKADYPDNTFDETLLENAISFDDWKRKLAIRLVVEKVIAKELIDEVQLSSEDIAEFYKGLKHLQNTEDTPSDEVNEKIVLQLRRLKAEEAYQAWMNQLRERYPVDINRIQWEKLIRAEEN